MRTNVIMMCAAAVFAGCAATGGGKRAITLQIDGAGGQTAYLDRFENNRPVHVDSVKLDADGKGVMHVAQLPLDFYRIALSDAQQVVLALDSADQLDIEAKADSLMMPRSISGSPYTASLHAFYKQARVYEDEISHLRNNLDQGSTDAAAMARVQQLTTEYEALCKKYITDNPGAPGTLSAVSKLNPQQNLDLFKQVKSDLGRTMGRSGFYKAYCDNLDRMQQQQSAQQAQEQQQKQLSNLVPVGQPAPDFRQNTPDGKTLALSDLRGKVVLVDFWASWCRPCRMENPNLVAAYKKYKDKGFDILGVSLDREKGAWTNAIQQDGLVWNHVSDLQWWNNAAAQQYGISSIPFSVLVDRDGNVIDKNLRGPALEAKLAEVLGS